MDPVCLDLDSDLDPNFYCFLEHVPSPLFLRSRTLNIQIIGCPLTSLLLIHICAWFLIRIVRSKQHGAKSYTHGPGPGYAFLPNPQSPIQKQVPYLCCPGLLTLGIWKLYVYPWMTLFLGILRCWAEFIDTGLQLVFFFQFLDYS